MTKPPQNSKETSTQYILPIDTIYLGKTILVNYMRDRKEKTEDTLLFREKCVFSELASPSYVFGAKIVRIYVGNKSRLCTDPGSRSKVTYVSFATRFTL